MAAYNSIEDIIRSHVTFTGAGQWNTCRCLLCGDSKKDAYKARGGWAFEADIAFYSCFNCGYKGSFSPSRAHCWSKGMAKVFEAFGIPKQAIMKLIADTRASLSLPTIPQRVTRLLQPISLPPHFYSLSQAEPDNLVAQRAKAFLQDEKAISPSSYPFYLSTCITSKDDPDAAFIKSLRNRLIIPFFKGEEMVYYIARTLDDSRLKYINLNKPKGNVVYGFNRLYEDMDSVLFVCEGWSDAHHVKGVAVLENAMSADQIDILEASPRLKVVIPDRKGDSNRLAEQAVELGWGISIPKMGECKDVVEGILQYGKLYVLDSIMSNIKHGRQASIALKTL